jgi:hypothetical protein
MVLTAIASSKYRFSFPNKSSETSIARRITDSRWFLDQIPISEKNWQRWIHWSSLQIRRHIEHFFPGIIYGIPLRFSNSVPDRHWRKINEPTGSLWIVITIVLRHSFQSLHPVLKHGSQNLRPDAGRHFTNFIE